MRVLLVDDEERLLGVLRRGLQREGFAVDVATDGEIGLCLARENDYDAIVLDIMLPVRNGYQVCAALREAGVWTPILRPPEVGGVGLLKGGVVWGRFGR